MNTAACELVTKANERELSQALTVLEGHFTEWRAGKIDCFDLGELIHRHHQGVARDLFSKYAQKPVTLLPVLVIDGLIAAEEVPPELLTELLPDITYIRKVRDSMS